MKTISFKSIISVIYCSIDPTANLTRYCKVQVRFNLQKLRSPLVTDTGTPVLQLLNWTRYYLLSPFHKCNLKRLVL